MTRPLIEIMRDAWASAIVQGRSPKEWLVNDAAKRRLLSEARDRSLDLPALKDGEFLSPIFGVRVSPAVKLFDQPDIARFELIVDELKEANPPCTECGSFDHFEC